MIRSACGRMSCTRCTVPARNCAPSPSWRPCGRRPADIAGAMLPLLVNELNALPGPVILVLDDYHRVKERSCHGQVNYLLGHLPPAVQLVLTTRADPPLPLARLRSTGDMVELRVSELRFTPAEAAALIDRTAGVALADSDLADLVGRTEGWPAGVYLAALSLRGHPSPGTFVRQFSGDSRYVADLLIEESCVARQPICAVSSAPDRHPRPGSAAHCGSAVPGLRRRRGAHRNARTGGPFRRCMDGARAGPAVAPVRAAVAASSARPKAPASVPPCTAGRAHGIREQDRRSGDQPRAHRGDITRAVDLIARLLVHLRHPRPGGNDPPLAPGPSATTRSPLARSRRTVRMGGGAWPATSRRWSAGFPVIEAAVVPGRCPTGWPRWRHRLRAAGCTRGRAVQVGVGRPRHRAGEVRVGHGPTWRGPGWASASTCPSQTTAQQGRWRGRHLQDRPAPHPDDGPLRPSASSTIEQDSSMVRGTGRAPAISARHRGDDTARSTVAYMAARRRFMPHRESPPAQGRLGPAAAAPGAGARISPMACPLKCCCCWQRSCSN